MWEKKQSCPKTQYITCTQHSSLLGEIRLHTFACKWPMIHFSKPLFVVADVVVDARPPHFFCKNRSEFSVGLIFSCWSSKRESFGVKYFEVSKRNLYHGGACKVPPQPQPPTLPHHLTCCQALVFCFDRTRLPHVSVMCSGRLTSRFTAFDSVSPSALPSCSALLALFSNVPSLYVSRILETCNFTNDKQH